MALVGAIREAVSFEIPAEATISWAKWDHRSSAISLSVVFVLAAEEVFIFCFIFNDSAVGLVFLLSLLDRGSGWGGDGAGSFDGGWDVSENKSALLEIQDDVFEADES